MLVLALLKDSAWLVMPNATQVQVSVAHHAARDILWKI
jgi:hypothetical protein